MTKWLRESTVLFVCVCVCVWQATCTGTIYLSWQRLTDCLLVALHGPRAVFAAGRRLGVGRQAPSALTQPNAAATGCPVPWRKMARTLQDTHISLATTTIRALSSNTHPPIQPPSSPRCRVNVSRRARRSPASGRPHPCPRLHHESDRGRIVSPLAGSAELLWRKLLRAAWLTSTATWGIVLGRGVGYAACPARAPCRVPPVVTTDTGTGTGTVRFGPPRVGVGVCGVLCVHGEVGEGGSEGRCRAAAGCCYWLHCSSSAVNSDY